MGVVVVDDPDLNGRGGAVVGDPLVVEELPDPGRLDLPQANVRPRDRRYRPGIGPPVAVEHGERPQVPGVVAHANLYNVPERAQIPSAVGVHDALGAPRGPRGVVYGDRLFLVLEHTGYRLRRALGKILLVRVALLARVLDAYPLHVFDVLEQVLQLGVHEDHLRPRVLDDVRDLVFAQARVYGDEHQPGGGDAEVPLEHRRGVRAEEGDAVALLEARVAQARGQAVHPLL